MLSHLNNKEVCGPYIDVAISGCEAKASEEAKHFRGEAINKMNSVNSGGFYGSTLNGMLAALGMPSLERIIDETFSNPDNYVTYVVAITRKGKNRTFKKKVSRKRVLHKDKRLDEFRTMINQQCNRWGAWQ